MSETIFASQLQVAHPLDEFYARARQPMPPLQVIDAEEIPAPYKQLLVHESDMTSTLELFHEQRIHLRVLSRQQSGGAYSREVVLELDDTTTPVEFGAIKIHLANFPEAARAMILKEHWPLGRILKEFGLSYLSRPKAFLRVASDRLISGALQLTGTHRLYGRRNTLSDPRGLALADIVEILPPV